MVLKSKSKTSSRPSARRNWCITSFDLKNFKTWKLLSAPRLRYLVYQIEACPKTEKKHIQAYAEFYSPVRMAQVKDILNDHALHLEVRRGTRQRARDYCMKDDSPWFRANYPDWNLEGGRLQGTDTVEVGHWGKQGARSDLLRVKDLIDRGSGVLKIMDECPEQFFKYHSAIEKCINYRMQKLVGEFHSNIKVHVLWGETGSGKTSYVTRKHGHENVFAPIWNGSKYWFDGYLGQKVLLINEFYGQGDFHFMQDLLDKSTMSVEVKCGRVVSQWDTIYVTSNMHPREWFDSWKDMSEQVQKSFMRRFDSLTFVPRPDGTPELSWDAIPELDLQSGQAPSITLPTSVTPPRASREPPGNQRKEPRIGHVTEAPHQAVPAVTAPSSFTFEIPEVWAYSPEDPGYG